jgi:Bacterial Ig-like domain (group 2)/Ricin-type beta-trefoil lectin domain-like
MKKLSTHGPPDRSKLRALCCLPFLLFAGFAQAQTLTSVAISPNQPSVIIGGTTQLTATASYSDGSSNNVSSSVAWSSADPRMVSVSASGLAAGNATGTVAITATYQGQTATAAISSSIGTIEWSGPLTITQGGTYSGNWKSTNPQTPAVTIVTTQPVLIQNSYITGPNDLISDPVYGNNVTVKNVIGIGVNPNVVGQPNGIFVDAQNPSLLDVENCYFENVEYGVWVRGYGGNYDGTETVTIIHNRSRNIVGTVSDGKGGSLPGETNWAWAHTVQLSTMPSVPGINVAWNEIINYPYLSLVNENISMYDAGGTASSPALLHDNYVQGAYAYNPVTDSYNGGGITTDGSSFDTVQSAAAFNNIYNNQVVATVNMGIEIGSGHDNAAYNNRVVSSGLLPNGTQIPSQNVGLSLYDVYGNMQNGSMYNDNMYNNSSGWMCWASRCAWDGYRNDAYLPDNDGDYALNPSIAANPITLQMEAAEYTAFQAKLISNGVVVGPVVSAGGSTPGGSGSGPASTISTTAWYNVVNTNSSLCVDAAGGGTANGTPVQQFTCGAGQANQEWQFQVTDGGYYRVVNRNASSATATEGVWDVTGGPRATAGRIPIQLWTYVNNSNQQWMPVLLGNGAFKFVVRNSSKCLDVPGASMAVSTQLQQFECNGTGAQSYTLQRK